MRYISTAQAAKLYGVTTRTIRAWLSTGQLKGRRLGKLWRVEVDDRQERAAQGLDGCTAHDGGVLISSTLKGEFTWIK